MEVTLYVREILKCELSFYKGPILEEFFRSLFQESKQYNEIRASWEHDHTDGIDLVAVNDLKKQIVIAEIKLNKEKIREGSTQKEVRSTSSTLSRLHS